MTSKTRTHVTYSIVHGEQEFPTTYKAETDYLPHHVEIVGDRAVVGYLVHDTDTENPLEASDCMGHVYSASRHAGKGQHEAMQEALGLDSSWEPNLSTNGVEDEAHRLFTEQVTASLTPELVEAVNRGITLFTGDTRPLTVAEIADRMLDGYRDGDWNAKWLAHSLVDGYPEDVSISEVPEELEELVWKMMPNLDDIPLEAWKNLRVAGKIGDPHVVVLDVYEHSGTHYSISGGGVQCAFDTARGGAIWVPDSYSRDDIVSRAETYRKGDIVKLRSKWYVNGVGDGFDCFMAAFHHLATLPDVDTLEVGLQRARDYVGQLALDDFNAWLAGDCYGVTIETYRLEDGKWVSVIEDSWGGYIGTEYAEQELKSLFDHHVRELAKAPL